MSIHDKYVWEVEKINRLLKDSYPIKSVSAIKSCIEADEANLLLEAVGLNKKARIFALISCFTYIPSVKCIEHLIAEGTPLNETFENNPFECSPQEFLVKHFDLTANKLHTRARNSIYSAIEKGKKRYANKEHIIINMDLPSSEPKLSTIKKVTKVILSPLLKKS
jgi:hypothetical protein